MSILTVFVTIFGSIVIVGAVITIVVLINKMRKRVMERNLSEEEEELSIEEQYHRVYGDK